MPAARTKSFFNMTPAQKESFVAKLERGIPASRLKPLSARERALWDAAKRGRGRPRKPAGAKAIPVRVTFEPQLLHAIDQCATHKGIRRAELLAQGARLALARMKRAG